MKPPDAELIARAQAGDPAAVAKLMKDGESVVRYIAACHRSVEHDDAVQTARVGFLVGLRRWRPGGAAFWAYLSIWAHGLIAWEAKKARTTAAHVHETPEDVALEEFASDLGASADAMEDVVAATQVRRLAETMPAQERCVAFGRFMYEQTLEDVGSALGVSRERVRQVEPNTMRKLRARATRCR